jgi:hypothetical protein
MPALRLPRRRPALVGAEYGSTGRTRRSRCAREIRRLIKISNKNILMDGAAALVCPGSEDYEPTTNGAPYNQYYIQTDIALSEATCGPVSGGTGTLSGCTVPPQGPGGFYPYWSFANNSGTCSIMFGNVSGSGLATFGKDAQYGTNQFNKLGYPEFIGPSINNPCL